MSLHSNWWMFWWILQWDLMGIWWVFSHRTWISWQSPFQKVACSIRTGWIFLLRHGPVPWVNMGYGIVIQNSEHDWTPKVSYTGYRKKKSNRLMSPKNHAIMASWHISNLIVTSPPSKRRRNTSQTHRTYALLKLHDFTSLLKTIHIYCIKLFDSINMPDPYSEMIHFHHSPSIHP